MTETEQEGGVERERVEREERERVERESVPAQPEEGGEEAAPAEEEAEGEA